MIKTIAFALFGLALASAAQAMPFSPVYQPDGMITQARMGCGAAGYGQWCLSVQSRHAPGAPGQPQVCTIFWRRLRSVSPTAASAQHAPVGDAHSHAARSVKPEALRVCLPIPKYRSVALTDNGI